MEIRIMVTVWQGYGLRRGIRELSRIMESPLFGWWSHGCTHIQTFIVLSTEDLCVLLYINCYIQIIFQ